MDVAEHGFLSFLETSEGAFNALAAALVVPSAVAFLIDPFGRHELRALLSRKLQYALPACAMAP
jgi:hypothetical protein